MLAKRPLTDRTIATLKPASPYRLAWDAIVPGLAVRVTATGQKSFVLVTRYPGSANPTARALGKVGALTLEDARIKGREWLKLIGSGVDPIHAARAAERDTLNAICEEFLRRDGAKLRSVDWVRNTLERLVWPVLGSQPITAIRRSDIVRLLDKIEDERGPVMANRTLAVIGRIMNWHASRSDDFRSPIVKGMTRVNEVARDRVLSDEEIRAVWSAGVLPVFCAFIRFLLLTAARRNEAAQMRWAELAGGDWTLPASRNKTGQELVRPLSRAAQAILADLPKVGEFVFSRNGKDAMGGISKMKAELDYTSKTSGWTLHDLRRTARSLMSRAGVPSDHAERCLGHVIGGVRGVYDRHAYRDEMLRAYEQLATLISGIVDPQPNVVVMRGRA
jgi:integrase